VRVALAGGVLAVSTASTFIRLAQQEAHPLAIAAWRLIIGGAVFLTAALIRRRDFYSRLSKKQAALICISGLLLAAHFGTWITSLALTSVTASVVIVTLYPLLAAIGSHLFLKERSGTAVWLGICTALAGSLIICMGDIRSGGHHITGDLLALAGAVSIAGYFIIGKRVRTHIPIIEYAGLTYSSAAVFLYVTVLVSGIPMTGFSQSSWLWIGLIALIPQITGHTLLNWSLKYMSATSVTMPILAEPVISVILAWIFLAESPPVQAVLGGVCVLAGLYMGLRKK